MPHIGNKLIARRQIENVCRRYSLLDVEVEGVETATSRVELISIQRGQEDINSLCRIGQCDRGIRNGPAARPGAVIVGEEEGRGISRGHPQQQGSPCQHSNSLIHFHCRDTPPRTHQGSIATRRFYTV